MRMAAVQQVDCYSVQMQSTAAEGKDHNRSSRCTKPSTWRRRVVPHRRRQHDLGGDGGALCRRDCAVTFSTAVTAVKWQSRLYHSRSSSVLRKHAEV